MEEIRVLEELFDPKLISVLKTLFDDSEKEFYLQELSTEANVPLATCSRIVAKLGKAEVIEIHKISRFKLYRLKQSEKVRFLSGLFKEDTKIVHKFTEEASKIKGVSTIILHGKETKDRANVLLIGTNIDPGAVKTLCAKIKEKYNCIISPLSLTGEQYNQMSQMGLYAGTKKVLYEGDTR